MGRELKRVPIGFDWPLDKVWSGFLMPDYLLPEPCPHCSRSGYNPETKILADSWYDSDNFGVTWTYVYGTDPEGRPASRPPWKVIGHTSRWDHSLTQDEVNALVEGGRLYDFTHTWSRDTGWVRREDGYVPTAREVNEWSQHGMGHDSLNRMICVEARATRLGVYGLCEYCKGRGSLYGTVLPDGTTLNADEHYELYNSWNGSDPPVGEAYQIWETVSEGSPVTPAFETPEELAAWLVKNDTSITKDTTYQGWLDFIRGPGWAPSMIVSSGGGMMSGVAASGES